MSLEKLTLGCAALAVGLGLAGVACAADADQFVTQDATLQGCVTVLQNVDAPQGQNPSWHWYELRNGCDDDVILTFRDSHGQRQSVSLPGRAYMSASMKAITSFDSTDWGDPAGVTDLRVCPVTDNVADRTFCFPQ
ncbi:MAG TPA: hypothetical protein VGL58_07500 [Caulobacteraceae bacterium]|jgi:hypothetical protein